MPCKAGRPGGDWTSITTGTIFVSFLLLCKVNMLMSESERQIICQCGQNSTQFMTSCENDCKSICSKFKYCASCKDGNKICASCPKGLSGSLCDIKDKKKRSISDVIEFSLRNYDGHRVKRSTCQTLRPPKAGQITCWTNQDGRECTGTCIPGYSFQNRREDTIVLRCAANRGVWEPERNFPNCISTGECDLEMAGPGKYNCTSTTTGTRCDVECGRDYEYSRYFCYPGRNWEPSLPSCVRRKGGVSVQTPPPPPPPPPYDCKCENGGTCDSRTRNCRCPQSYRGRFCEEYIRPKATCSDPGYIRNGDRINSGVYSSRGLYEEGESVAYSCRHGYALVGNSLLTCQSTGKWTFSAPTCQRIAPSSSSTTTTTPKPIVRRYCSDPGFIVYGDRWSSEGRASSRGDVFEVGKSVVFSCRSGYALQGLSILTCLDSLQWSNILPECREIRPTSGVSVQTPPPPPPPPPHDCKCENGGTCDTRTRNCRCPQNYRGRFCEEFYDDEEADDGIIYCPDPGRDVNAIRTENAWLDARRKNTDNGENEFPQGFRLNYKCKKGYTLEGESTLLCLFTGEWSSDIPACYNSRPDDIAYCKDPGEIEHAVKLVVTLLDERKRDGVMKRSKDLEYPEGVKLRYICMDGYRLQGKDTIQCTSNGEWDIPPPYCIPDDKFF